MFLQRLSRPFQLFAGFRSQQLVSYDIRKQASRFVLLLTMVSTYILGIAALAVLAGAQSTTSTDPITPTPFYSTITTTRTRAATVKATGAAETHTVAVGAVCAAYLT